MLTNHLASGAPRLIQVGRANRSSSSLISMRFAALPGHLQGRFNSTYEIKYQDTWSFKNSGLFLNIIPVLKFYFGMSYRKLIFKVVGWHSLQLTRKLGGYIYMHTHTCTDMCVPLTHRFSCPCLVISIFYPLRCSQA